MVRKGTAFDLLLSDVAMPGGVTGWDLARTAWTLRPSPKILLMTGHADHAVLGEIAADGRATILDKPFTRTSLARTIAETLRAGQSINCV